MHEETVTFLFKIKNKTQKKQVHGQEVVPVGISVLKKQVSWLCNQNLFGSGISFVAESRGSV